MLNHGTAIKALFLDIGGVLLTNGWDTQARKDAAVKFGLDFEEMNSRHRVIFDAYESGKSSLDEYLNLLVFYEKRDFDRQDFKEFMTSVSHPYPDMIKLISDIKHKYKLRTIAVNNEGKELNEYRVKTFHLKGFIDVFSSSCTVRMRKPDKEFFQIALDLAQVKPKETLYLDDRLVFIQAAAVLGINGLHHVDIETTKQKLAGYGLEARNLTEHRIL